MMADSRLLHTVYNILEGRMVCAISFHFISFHFISFHFSFIISQGTKKSNPERIPTRLHTPLPPPPPPPSNSFGRTIFPKEIPPIIALDLLCPME